MNSAMNYLLVDDDSVHNHICTAGIKKYHPEAAVTSFTDPAAALAFIKNEYLPAGPGNIILLLDLNMPMISGWEFLAELDTLEEQMKRLFDVYILTSSIDERDREKAWSNNMICGFMEKPLTAYQLDSMAYVRSLKDNSPVDENVLMAQHSTYHIGATEKQLLDMILPDFRLNEIINVQKCLRSIQSSRADMHNIPVNLYADNIRTYLIANSFAHNLSGDPLINKKGMELKLAGGLHNFEKLDYQRSRTQQ